MEDNSQGAAEQVDATEQVEQKSDPIQEVKGEMHRKFDNITSQLQKQNQDINATLNAIVESLRPNRQQQQQQQEEDMSDMMLTDPKRAIQIISERATQNASQTIRAELQASQATQNTVASLAMEYPELKQNDSDLAKKAVAIYDTLSNRVKDTPEGMEIAVRKAAALLGVVPVDKRKKAEPENEDFAIGSSASSANKRTRSQSTELDQTTLQFAKLMGLNTDDPKVVASLKKRAERKTWNRYE